jgi:hypothetical protein
MKRIFLLAALFVSGQMLLAQLPTSNIFLFDLQRGGQGDSLYLSNPKFLTEYNKNGYNNHPDFFSDEELMISSQIPYEAQPDLYSLNLTTLVRTRVTDTDAGEYSPRRMPDYFNFSAVRMEYVDQDTFIRLWQFPLDRSGNGRPVFRDMTNVGYYAWLNGRDVMLHKNGSPNQLVRADVYSQSEEVVATNIGRCFIPTGTGALLFLQKNPNGQNDIMLYDSRAYYEDQKLRKVVPALSGSQDFAVLQDGTLLMAFNSELFQYQVGKDTEWKKLADLRGYNIKGITRLAVSPNNSRIAIVAQ